MNYYRRYVGDYLRDTARLTLLEHGAYTLLMDYYYADERALPADKDEIYLMVRAMTPADRKAVDKVLSTYFTLEADGFHQSRIDEELARAHDASETARKAGEKGAASRWGKQSPRRTNGGSDGGGHSEPYDDSHNGSDGAGDSGANGEAMAESIATRGGDPTTNHQPPPPNLQPPVLPTGSTSRATPKRRAAPKRPLPEDFAVSPRVEAWAAQKGFGRLAEHLDAFRAKCVAHGYAYADWDAAFMEAIREDWAGLRGTRRGAGGRSRSQVIEEFVTLGGGDAAH